MFSGKDGHQFRILVEGAEVLLVIDLRAVGVQVNSRQMVALLELLRHLAADLLQTGGADSLLNVACYVLDLAIKTQKDSAGKRE